MVLPTFFLLVPMYIYPNPGVWDTLFNSIAKSPSVNWKVIVNPNSGPGGSTPDPNYVAAVSKLNTYPNVHTLGYVHTSYATRPLSTLLSEIDTYASWATCNNSSHDIHLGGIFFDEAPIDTSALSYMTQASAHARSVMPLHGNYTLFNPGCVAPEAFYEIADAVLAFEDKYAVDPATGLAKAVTAVPEGLRSRSAVMINTYRNTSAQMAVDTKALMEEGIAGLWITTKPSYGSYSAGWSQFWKDVVKDLGTK